MGFPADAETRDARISAHGAVESLRESKEWSRDELYIWIAMVMEKPPKFAHIAQFTAKECQKLMDIAAEEKFR